MRTLLFAAFVILSFGCDPANVDPEGNGGAGDDLVFGGETSGAEDNAIILIEYIPGPGDPVLDAGPEVDGGIAPWQMRCTGTMIAPDLVLTARHCGCDAGPHPTSVGCETGLWLAPERLRIRVGHERASAQPYSVATLHHVVPLSDVTYSGQDVLVFQLREAVPHCSSGGVDGNMLPHLRQRRIPSDGSGGTLILSAVQTDASITASPCGGDSGSPLVDQFGSIVAVASMGSPRCNGQGAARATIFPSSDAHRDRPNSNAGCSIKREKCELVVCVSRATTSRTAA